MSRIGILAGGGRLPLMIAESAAARGEAVHIVGIEGEADAAIARFPHTWVNWGQIGRMVAILQDEGGRKLVIAGAVTRPDLRRIRPDAGFFRSLPQILAPAGGRRRFRADAGRALLRGQWPRGAGRPRGGARPAGGRRAAWAASPWARPIAPTPRSALPCGARSGPSTPARPSWWRTARCWRSRARRARTPCSSAWRRLPCARLCGAPQGVLAKGPKPGQELRVDMPAIGPRTIEQAAAAGLAGRGGRGRRRAGARPGRGHRHRRRARLRRLRPRRRGSVAGSAGRGRARRRIGRVIGRLRPSRRDAGDIERGLAAVECLAPFATGSGAVVVRHYVRAIEAAEGAAAMLERAAALRRQWGLRWRKVGVFVRRATDADRGRKRARGPARPGGCAGARRHRRDRPAARARRLGRTRGGSRMTSACFWCCVRRREREAGRSAGSANDSGRRTTHEGEDLLGRGPGPAAVHRRGRALGRRARRQADGGAERAPPRPRALRRRRRRADGGAGPRLAVPHGGRGGDGGGRDPGAAAQAPRPRLRHCRRRGCRRARRARHHRQPRVHAPDRQARAPAQPRDPHHRLRVAERVGLAARPGAQDARLCRPRAGAAAVRAGRAFAPRRPALHLRRPSADRAPAVDRRARPCAAGPAPGAAPRYARCWWCCRAAGPRRSAA